MQPSEEGDDDGGEAVIGRERRDHLPEGTCRFKDAGKACQPAAGQQRGPDGAPGIEPSIAGGGRCCADNADAEPEHGARHDEPRDERNDERNRHAQMHHGSRHHRGQELPVGEHARLREVEALGVLPRTAHQVVEQLNGDIGQHQAGEYLVDVEPRAQDCGYGGVGHAARDTGKAHGRQNPPALHAPGQQGDAGARQSAHDILSLGTDVPDVGAEPDGKPHRNQDQRRSLHAEVLPLVGVEQRSEEDLAHRAEAVVTDERKDDGAGQHGRQHCDDRRQVQHDPARFLALLQLNEHGPPP